MSKIKKNKKILKQVILEQKIFHILYIILKEFLEISRIH